jgi:hypothetical protein
MPDAVRLCVQSLHPIHPGNYAGPIHCTAHPDGHACVTALYERVPDTTMTADERHAACQPRRTEPWGHEDFTT